MAVGMFAKGDDKVKVINEYPEMFNYFGIYPNMPQAIPDHLLKRLLYRKLPDELKGDNPVIVLQSTNSPNSNIVLECSVDTMTGDAGGSEKLKALMGNINKLVGAECELGAVAKIMLSSTIAMSNALNLTNTSDYKNAVKKNEVIVKRAETNSTELWAYIIGNTNLDQGNEVNAKNFGSKFLGKMGKNLGAFGGGVASGVGADGIANKISDNMSYDNIAEIVENQLKNICNAMRIDWDSLGWEYEPSSSRSFFIGFGSMGIMAAAATATAISSAANNISRSARKSEFDYANIFVKFNEIVEIFNRMGSSQVAQAPPPAQAENKFCRNCGGKLATNAIFCGGCGTKQA